MCRGTRLTLWRVFANDIEGEFDRETQDAESYAEYVHSYADLIRSAGARPALLMDWQFDESRQCLRCSEIDEIVSVNTSLGSAIEAEVAPAGIAWERVLAEQPHLKLYSEPNMHENDPSPSGTYLATAVLFSVLFDRSPEGLDYGPEDVWPPHEAFDDFRQKYMIPDEDRSYLQRIAWETVQAYQEAQGSSH